MIPPPSRSPFERVASAWSPAARYGAALLLVLVTTGLIALVNSDWGVLTNVTIENPATVFVATVTLIAILFGLGPALMAVGTSMLAVYLVFAKHESASRMVVLVATMLIIIALAERQRRAQDAAERVRAQLAAIVESMSDAVMVVDATGRATNVNHAAIAMLGSADRGDALTRVMHRRADGTPATDEYALLERALGGEDAPQTDVLIPDGTDEPRTVSAVANPMRDARGRIIGAVSVSRDITDRLAETRERERLLRQVEQERQYSQHILENVPVGIAVVRADDFTLLSFNEEYDASIRRAPGAMALTTGRSLLDAMPTSSHDAATRLLSLARDEHRMIRNAAYSSAVVPDQFYDGTIQPLRLGDGTPALLITSVNVTERVQAERERETLLSLVEERRRFTQAIFDTVPVALAVVDTDALVFEAANPAFLTSVPAPYDVQGVNGRALATVLPHTSENGFADQLRTVGDTGEPFHTFATRYEHPARGTTYWNETMIPIVTSDTATHHVLYIAADVTEQTEAQQRITALAQAAGEHANQLEAVFGALTEGLILTDAAGVIVRSNAALARILGLDGEPVPPLNTFGERFAMRDAEGLAIPQANRVALAALDGATATGQLRRFRDARGEERWMSVSASPVRDDAGAITGVAMTMRDVTDERRAVEERERLLREVEQRERFTQAIFDSVPVGLMVVGVEDGVIRTANNAYARFIDEQFVGGDVIGRKAALLQPTGATTPLPENAEEQYLTGLRNLAEGRTSVTVREFAYPDFPGRGETFWDLTGVPLFEADGAVNDVLVLTVDTTEQTLNRRKVEELAETAAQRAAELEAIIANMPDGVAIYGPEGNLIQMNAAGQRSAAADDVPPSESLTEAVGRYGFSYPDGRPIPLDDLPLARALRGETVSGYEFVSQTRRGPVYRLASSAPITNAAGEITRAVVMFTDITARKHAEQERERLLREVEEGRAFARTVIDSAPAGIVVFGADPDFTVRLANDQFMPLLRGPWRGDGVIGVPLAEFLPRAEESGILAIFRRVVETGEPVSLAEFEYAGESGRTIFYDWSLVPLREGGDRVTGLILLISDVTDRVLSRQRIEELAWDAAQRASELETVIASIADGVMVTDADGRITLENDASRRLTGRAQSAVAFDLVTQAEAQNLRNADGTPVPPHDVPLGRAVRGATVTDQVLIVRRVDTGEDRFLICSSAPVRAGGDAITGAVAVFRDITEMKQLDQMKDEFISIAAHELRTPLTAIKGYAELLDRRLSAQTGREGDRKSLGIIRKQTERLSGLVNEMLDVSRIEGGRLQLNSEPFDLSALAAEVVNNLRVSTTTHILSLAAEPAIEALGDTARIEQVLINLISNAITYSPEGGEIGVRAWAEGESALVSVSDQGVGIAPEELPHLFDRFYRAPSAEGMRSGGMGLGLYICQEIIARHGGTIRADSTLGAGSIFTFTLPLTREGQRAED
jgi:two-component system, OmpR family, phosphate regulon sensor histidine kinase PhoR